MDVFNMKFRFEQVIEGGNFIEKTQAKSIIMNLYDTFARVMNAGITEDFNKRWEATNGKDSFESEEYEKNYSEMAMFVAKSISESGIGKLITGKHVYLDKGLDCILLDPNKGTGVIYGKIE